jgi:hypothetical protein
MVMSQDQNTGRSYNINSDNSSFEWVDELKYLGTTLTNRTSIQEEIKSRLKKSEIACYHSVQNILSYSLLSNNINVKKYITIILSVVFMSVKLGLSH